MPYIQNEKVAGLETKATPAAGDYMLIGDTADSGRAKKSLFSSFVSAVANYITNTVGGFVNTVTGLDTDNTDPQNPVVRVATDGVTILGDGTPGNPLSSVGGAGGGGAGGVGGKPMTFAIPSAGAGSLNPSIGYQDREAYAFGAGNINFYLQDATGYTQIRDVSTDWASATITGGHALIGNALYLLLLDTSGLEARIYKYDASDLSLGGAQMTISGATLGYDTGLRMTSNGTKLYLNFDAGNSASANEIAGFTISGTTATYVSTITCGASTTPFDGSDWAVTSVENYYGLDTQVLYQYDNTGTLTYTSGASGASGVIINWDDTLYVGESSTGLNVKLFLPDTELDSGVDKKKVGVGEIGDIQYFNIQYPFTGDSVTATPYDIWDLTNATIASPSHVNLGAGEYVTPNNADYTAFFPDLTNGDYAFNSGKQIIASIIANVATPANENCGIGFDIFGAAAANKIFAQQGTNDVGIGFIRDNAAVWYARCGNGAAFTETPITIANGNHVFRIEYDPGNVIPQARFYVDGLLLVTIITTLPTGVASVVAFTVGNDGGCTTIGTVGCPSFAVEI